MRRPPTRRRRARRKKEKQGRHGRAAREGRALRRRPALRRHRSRVANYFETLCGDLEKVEIQGFEDNPERCCGIACADVYAAGLLDRALTLDGESFKGDGRTMKIRRDRTGNKPRRPPPPAVAGSLTVYVGNMPWAASKEDVEAMLVMRDVLYVDALPHGRRDGAISGFRARPNCGRVVSIECVGFSRHAVARSGTAREPLGDGEEERSRRRPLCALSRSPNLILSTLLTTEAATTSQEEPKEKSSTAQRG